MAKKKVKRKRRATKELQGITAISVCGYKSIAKECTIKIRPLTILAGANSSGKSSIMQPLLLLKQTLEAPIDPGALRLNGPNVNFSSATELLSKIKPTQCSNKFYVKIEKNNISKLTTVFRNKPTKGFNVEKMTYVNSEDVKQNASIWPKMTYKEILDNSSNMIKGLFKDLSHSIKRDKEISDKFELTVSLDRCFLGIDLSSGGKKAFSFGPLISPSQNFKSYIANLIHLPGLRGNPERAYIKTPAIGPAFPGIFTGYTAGIISHWKESDKKKLTELENALKTLGLSQRVNVNALDDTTVELKVSRIPKGHHRGLSNMVNIADVGFGVSQTLPVVVALLVAEPGQLVYLEQPEIHLHPKARIKMAEILVDAANRGVRVVVETHSALLLKSIQTLVAQGKLKSDKAILHWFNQNKKDGTTEISSADLDDSGAFGDWPEDFGEVELSIESQYIEATEKRLLN
ncbi:MAG TPA: DUF3696 domain-containing protein [Nitrospirae bacterium]|nr:DUF3696 domain-containing protein [Nitrospirota bacterium]